ncbi:MAG: hypothetical protein KDB68_06515 [Planctomycetes bacterium]|nr:hypothetical protein [Planctomycetota bacterium]MCA8935842.1 hypothetical protein [Planctomycetota bacterium]
MTPEQKKAARIAWVIGLLVLGAIVLVDLGVHHHAHFEKDNITFDTLPEFWPLYGFTAAFVLLIAAKTLAVALKRKDTFYADD